MSLLSELALMEVEKKEKEAEKGTYVGAKFDDATNKFLEKMIKKLKIPNPITKNKFHTTIIFSRKPFEGEYTPLGDLDKPWEGVPDKFEIFTGRNDQNCLVLRYNCPEQTKRHKTLMKKYDAVYDWDEFKCHLTVSYDCGDFDVDKFKPSDYIEKIVINHEYTEDLDLNWLANKDKPETEESSDKKDK